jgi:hypothetical protein
VGKIKFFNVKVGGAYSYHCALMGEILNITEHFTFPISLASLSQSRWLPNGDVSWPTCIGEKTQFAAAHVGAAGIKGAGETNGTCYATQFS